LRRPALQECLNALAGVGLLTGPPEQDALALQGGLAVRFLEELPRYLLGYGRRRGRDVLGDIAGHLGGNREHVFLGDGA